MKGNDKKPYIGFLGRRNNGKSSLINALVGQEVAIVSEHPGTTTDPVKKSIEIFGIGPVVLVDTAGIDDEGDLGQKRIQKSFELLKQIDLAVLVISNYQWNTFEQHVEQLLLQLGTPFIIVNNKADLLSATISELFNNHAVINVSATTGNGIPALIEAIKHALPDSALISHSLLGNVINDGDEVLMITPIDSEAPEGRLILPQVQLIRDVLDNNAIVTVLKEDKIASYLDTHIAPKLIITDSQVFKKVAPLIPEEIPLTGFSIVLAHHKGDFEHYLQGTPMVDSLQDNDHILMLESCTHLSSCEDIGRVKIPRWIQNYTGKNLLFTFVSGLDAVPDISQFAMVIQCGGCMITRKQILNRLKPAIEKNIPVTNYGMLIAYMNGIFERATRIFLK